MKKKILILSFFIVVTAATAVTYYNYANIPFPTDVVNNLQQMDNTPASNLDNI